MTVLTKEKPVIFHFRAPDKPTKGGITVVYEPSVKRFGVAVCSKKDNFNKRRGVLIASGRAYSPRQRLGLTLASLGLLTGIKIDKDNITFEHVARMSQKIAEDCACDAKQTVELGPKR